MAIPAVWLGRLNAAKRPEEVVAVCGDFLATWTPDALGRLPREFVPARIADVEDVSNYAFQLLQQQLATDPGAVEMQQMTEFFVAASQRLSQLLARSAPPPAS